MQENVEGVATLKQRVGSLVDGLRELHAQSGSHPLPPGMKVKIEGLIEYALRRYTVAFSSLSYRSWTAIEERAGRIKSRGRIMRFLRSKRDAKKLGELIGEINDSIQDKIVVSQASDTLYADADTILVARNPGNCARSSLHLDLICAQNIERYMEEISKTMQKVRRPRSSLYMI